MKKLTEHWFICVFIVILLIPIYGWILDKDITLKGVASMPEIVPASLETCADGSYQAYLNTMWENGFPGRKFFLRIRNQLLYSILQVSPNSNVVIGRSKYLYEPGATFFEIQVYPPSSEDYFEQLGNDLHELNQVLQENNKELYVFITPTKAHFTKDNIPARYSFLDNEGNFGYTNYSKLLETLNTFNINYYDAIDFISRDYDSGVINAPVFYKSGWHWSHPWGENAAANLLDYMNECSRYDLSSIKVKELACEEPIEPDDDLYSTLNLLLDAKEQWYTTEVTVEKEGADHPNVFFRGCSFMGQSLNILIRSGVFGEDVHLENNYYFTDQYKNMNTISSFTAYDELNLDELMGQSDILVLEVNESHISNMSFEFISYLLEHRDYLNRDY